MSKCSYCGFYSTTSRKTTDNFIEAIKREIALRTDYINDKVETVYLGGGTPTTLTTTQLNDIVESLFANFDMASNLEMTIEANPDTISLQYLRELGKIGFNRLSIGIQSFFDDDLRTLGRRHDSTHAVQCIADAHKAGFDNISIDLIYGIPNSHNWEKNLDIFFDLGLNHLSAYALTIEDNSVMKRMIEQGKMPCVSDDDAADNYKLLCDRCRHHGFLHYEISNFCKPGCHSRHNSSYWNGTHYLGLGPAAHSYNGASRQWNIANATQYIKKLLEGDDNTLYELETLDEKQRYNEYVITALRTLWGCDLVYIRREMGSKFADYYEKKANALVERQMLSRTNEFFHLDDQQMLMADNVAVELMID